MGIAAAIGVSAVAGIAGSAIQGSAAKSAANTQVQGEDAAAQVQQNMYNQTVANLKPYNTAGQAAATSIAGMSPYTAPSNYTPPTAYNPGTFNFNDTQAQLEATPGYQFTMDQGLESTQNSYAARGLGTSGAAEKGAASYATGLADTTYQNQFTNALNTYTNNATAGQNAYNTNQSVAQNAFNTNTTLGQNTYNINLQRQQNLANLGENAAAQTGQAATTTAGNIGATYVGAANASAAGQVGSAQAAASGLGSIGSALTTNAFFNNGANPFSTAASAGGSIYGGGGFGVGSVDPSGVSYSY